MRESILQKKSFDFAVMVIDLCYRLNQIKSFVISNQLLRSGTSIGANIEEAGAALTRKDFVAKLSIAAKEAREAKYWLRLIQHSNICQIDCQEELILLEEVIRLLTASIKTAQKGMKT